MSSRALRRLRVEAASVPADDNEDGNESESSSDDDEGVGGGGGGGFMAMLEEESSSDEEESESSDDDDDDEPPSAAASAAAAVSNKSSKKKQNDEEDEEEEEDLDAILNEMKIQTSSTHDDNNADESNADLCTTTLRSILLSRKHGYDIQDLDLDYSLRSLLGGGGDNNNPLHINNDDLQFQQQQQQQQQRGRNARGNRGGRNNRRMVTKKYLFGKPKIEWGKPPSFVGGGLGVKELTPEEENTWSIPWPYNTINGKDTTNDSDDDDDDDIEEKLQQQQQKWFTFQMSDTYTETNRKYEILMDGQMGDPNTLAMFVADNPFFAETILQMAMVLYYVNDRGRGSDLLRRSMFIYESALPSSLLPGNNDSENNEIFMDYERKPNAGFFSTLFRIMQTSGMSGCHPNAMAVGRYLLSLDPLRDPMGVLLILDYYALASRRSVALSDDDGGEEGAEVGAAFIVDLVESEKITINYKDPLTSRHHKCPLLQMPNWAFAYALALNRLSRSDEADEALIDAMEQFPLVLPKLLEMNKVNVQGRSFQMDWPKVLPAFNHDLNPPINDETIEARVTRAAGEHLVRIFVERNHKLWKEDDVLMWMYKCSEKLVANVIEPKLENEDSALEESSSTAKDVPSKKLKSTFSPALARYAQCDPSDYEDSFRTFPPEAIALDPNLVGPALVHDHRRGRFLRGRRGGGGVPNREDMEAVPADLVEQLRGMLGMAGGADNELLDPDSPLLQLYLQALLPWNQVDGVRPPR